MNKKHCSFLLNVAVVAMLLTGCKGEVTNDKIIKMIYSGLAKCQSYIVDMEVLTGLQNNPYTLRIHYKSPDKYRLVSGDGKRITIYDGKNTFLINKGIPDELQIDEAPFYPHHMLPHNLMEKLLEAKEIRIGEYDKDLSSIQVETIGVLNNGQEGIIRYWISDKNGFPIMVEQYDTNGLLVWGVSFNGLKMNIDIDDEVFSPKWQE